jgi:hypothetical protein
MVVNKITPLVNSTSAITKFSPEVVASVVGHTLSFTSSFLKSPTHAGIRLTYFGVLRPNLKALNYYLKYLIRVLRTSPTPEITQEFKTY